LSFNNSAKCDDACLEGSVFEAPKNSRFANHIFYDINLMLPNGTGNRQSEGFDYIKMYSGIIAD
jgi:hypothetical protein